MIIQNLSRPRGGIRAFTLIELLTVIAIIGILASILIPVVGKVRENARRVKCGSNMRQVALAVLTYESENGVLPGPTEREIRSPLLGDARPGATSPKEVWPTMNVDLSILLESYVGITNAGDVGPFECPSNEANAKSDPRIPVFLIMRNVRTSPPSFFGDTDSGVQQEPKSLSQIKAAGTGFFSRQATEFTQIWMVSDIDRYNTVYYGGDASVDLDMAHDGGRNYAFFDGHLEYLKPAKWSGGRPDWNYYPASTGDEGNHGN